MDGIDSDETLTNTDNIKPSEVQLELCAEICAQSIPSTLKQTIENEPVLSMDKVHSNEENAQLKKGKKDLKYVVSTSFCIAM